MHSAKPERIKHSRAVCVAALLAGGLAVTIAACGSSKNDQLPHLSGNLLKGTGREQFRITNLNAPNLVGQLACASQECTVELDLAPTKPETEFSAQNGILFSGNSYVGFSVPINLLNHGSISGLVETGQNKPFELSVTGGSINRL